MSTEKEKMLSGELYSAADPELVKERLIIRNKFTVFNRQTDPKSDLIKDMVNVQGNYSIEPPFFCDYGSNITLGNNVKIGRNCVILDVGPVKIGENTIIGDNCGLYSATHPLDYKVRSSLLEYGFPITIGKDVIIGSRCVFCPNITIGDRVIVEPGSVVTKNIPSDSHIFGNPAKPIQN